MSTVCSSQVLFELVSLEELQEISYVLSEVPLKPVLVAFIEEDVHDVLRFLFKSLHCRSSSESMTDVGEGVLDHVELEQLRLVEHQERTRLRRGHDLRMVPRSVVCDDRVVSIRGQLSDGLVQEVQEVLTSDLMLVDLHCHETLQ